MTLNDDIRNVMGNFLARHGDNRKETLLIEGEDAWTLRVSCDLPGLLPQLRLRCLNDNDVPALFSSSRFEEKRDSSLVTHQSENIWNNPFRMTNRELLY